MDKFIHHFETMGNHWHIQGKRAIHTMFVRGHSLFDWKPVPKISRTPKPAPTQTQFAGEHGLRDPELVGRGLPSSGATASATRNLSRERPQSGAQDGAPKGHQRQSETKPTETNGNSNSSTIAWAKFTCGSVVSPPLTPTKNTLSGTAGRPTRGLWISP